MNLVFKFLNHLQLFGIIELWMVNIFQLFLELVNSFIFTLDYFFVCSFSLFMSIFFFNYMFTQPIEFFLSHSYFLIDNLVGFLELFLVFSIELLNFPQLNFTKLGSRRFALDIFNEVSTGKKHHASLVLKFLLHVILH